MKSWNEIRKAATAFSKRWKNAYGLKPTATDSDRVALLFRLYADKISENGTNKTQ